MKKINFVIFITIGLIFSLYVLMYAQSANPIPVKVTYQSYGISPDDRNYKKQEFFKLFSVYLPNELIGFDLDYNTPFEPPFAAKHLRNIDGTIHILLIGDQQPEYSAMKMYGVDSQYELKRKEYYSEISPIMRAVYLKIEDVSAANWHGFCTLSDSGGNNVSYSFNVFSYDNKKFTNINFSIINNALSERDVNDIMATFQFLD